AHKKYATLTAVQPTGKYGGLKLGVNNEIKSFIEKPPGDGSWVNGGFFVLEPQIFEYIKSDETVWEKEPLESLAKQGQLMAYKYSGFWRCMDTLRDKKELEELWNTGKANWKIW
ncbi:MAG: sugar phosphate nucleotidyltransferase, partial [Candidatus Micrarchaeia archaeon]